MHRSEDAARTGREAALPSVEPELFKRVSAGRIPELIVEQIRILMREGQLRPGDRLPPERDLCAQFGVSRVTVREALRVLESSGLLEIRMGGTRGGAFVTAPSRNRLGEGLTDLLALSAISAIDVTEVRLVLEVGIVPLVCERATEEDLADLEKICRRSEEALTNGDYTVDMSLEFHMRVAAATHNPALSMLVESFRDPVLISLQQAKDAAPEKSVRGSREHRRFTQALGRRDAVTASRIMTEHLTRTARRLGR